MGGLILAPILVVLAIVSAITTAAHFGQGALLGARKVRGLLQEPVSTDRSADNVDRARAITCARD
jgi:hypothetical protein